MTKNPKFNKILVTGGSGYIAGYCISQLISINCKVNATIRTLNRETEVRTSLSKNCPSLEELTFYAANLESEDGWNQAMQGVDAVLHIASPLPTFAPKDEMDIIRPARDGALRVLKAAKANGVKKVVMTASTAAISYGHGSYDTPATEENWSDETNKQDSSAYERSKTIAERAAWAWWHENGGDMEFCTICPGAVIGPVLGNDFSPSIDIIKKLIDGSMPGMPRFGWPLVDVRDIAALHILALNSDKSNGQRFIGAGDFVFIEDIAKILRDAVPTLASKAPKMNLPDFLVRFAAIFDPVIKERLYELNKNRPVSSQKAKDILGWNPRPYSVSIADTANSLVKEKIVKI